MAEVRFGGWCCFCGKEMQYTQTDLAKSSSRLLLAELRFGGVTLSASRNALPTLRTRRASSRQPISNVSFPPIADISSVWVSFDPSSPLGLW